MWRNIVAGIVVSTVVGGVVCDGTHAAVPVVWDGSAGISSNPTLPTGVRRWEEGNWTKDGMPGQTAAATMGDTTGGRGGVDIVIGGGVTVYHDHNDGNTVPGALGDFKPRMDLNGPGSLTIKEGATLWFDAHSDLDGRWSRMDIDVNLDNGTLLRTLTPGYCPPSECSVSGGRIIFGYNNDLLPDTILHWNLTNGGRIESHGKMTWGNPNFWEDPVDDPQTGHNSGIGVIMTINDGTLDLTGGNAYDDFFGLVNGELIFFYESIGPTGTPKNETYVINFTGPGQIIVDNGVFIAKQDSTGVYQPDSSVPDLYTPITYQRLWDEGILQANGQSGMTGATFGDYFTTSGSPGSPDYTLTSLVAPPTLDGDYNGDGKVDAADYVRWRKDPAGNGGDPGGYNTWRQNFGRMSGSASGTAAVPEPAGLVATLLGVIGVVFGRRRRLR